MKDEKNPLALWILFLTEEIQWRRRKRDIRNSGNTK